MFDEFNQPNKQTKIIIIIKKKNDECQEDSEIMLFDMNNLGYAGQFMYCAWTVGRRKRNASG